MVLLAVGTVGVDGVDAGLLPRGGGSAAGLLPLKLEYYPILELDARLSRNPYPIEKSSFAYEIIHSACEYVHSKLISPHNQSTWLVLIPRLTILHHQLQ